MDNGNGNRLTGEATYTQAEVTQLVENVTSIVSRMSLASYLGKSYGGARDLYQTLGYKRDPVYEDYLAAYTRGDIAKALIDRPIDSSWAELPLIKEQSKSTTTALEAAWVELADEHHLLDVFQRADRMAGLGTYSVIWIGLEGRQRPDEAARNGKLLYLQPYDEASAKIMTWDRDVTSRRYGLPSSYQITPEGGTAIHVHHTRVVHIAEERLQSNVHGTPQLECVLNRLWDLQLVLGGSAESYWRAGVPGLGIEAKEGATFSADAKAALNDELEKFVHGIQRWLKIGNATIKELAGTVADPSATASLLIRIIAGAKDIPERILTGSERGELASTQDRAEWASTVEKRRRQHCEPNMVRALVDRLVRYGALDAPATGKYNVVWSPLHEPSAADRAEVASKVAVALEAFAKASTLGIELPFSMFLSKYLAWSEDEIRQAETLLGDMDRLASGVGDEPDEEGDEA